MSYKLYIGGYRHIQGVTVAKDDAEAERKLREELRLGSLPCEFSEVKLGEHAIVLKESYIDNAIDISQIDVQGIREFTEQSIETVKQNIAIAKKKKEEDIISTSVAPKVKIRKPPKK